MLSSARASPSIKTRAVAFSNRSITSVWKSNLSCSKFSFFRSHRRLCDIAAAPLFKRSRRTSSVTARSLSKSKPASALVDEHRAQLLNYLSATECELGLLVNFGHYPKMKYERLITKKQEPADVYL